MFSSSTARTATAEGISIFNTLANKSGGKAYMNLMNDFHALSEQQSYSIHILRDRVVANCFKLGMIHPVLASNAT